MAASPTKTRLPRLLIATLVTLISATFALVPATSSDNTPLAGQTSTAAAHVAAVVDPSLWEAVAQGGEAQVIVSVAPEALASAEAAVHEHGGELLVPLPIIEGFSARVGADALAALVEIAGVRSIAIDGSVELAHEAPLGEANGDYFFPQTVGAEKLWAKEVDGSGVGIAVVDTGISEVTDLAGRVVGGFDFSGEGDTVDRYGHGTFIAGIAAGDGAASNGKFKGVAPGAHVVPVKIAGANGYADVSHVLAGIQYVVSVKDEYDIGVLNLSVGTDSRQPNALSPLNYAVERAWEAGIVVVVSGGNWGEHGPGNIPKPADDPLVITVGATDSNGTKPTHDDSVAPYSSRGPSIADKIVKPDLVAPGSHIVGPKAPGSTVDVEHPEAHIRNDYMRGSGTSFSAAVVSGAVALLRDAHPSWSPDLVKGALLATARPGPVGDPNVDGKGIVDVASASSLLLPPNANTDVLVRSTGLGLMGEDRGSFQTTITVDGLAVNLDLSTELTAQNRLFDALTYTTSDWTTSGWYTSGWYTSGWYTSGWYTSGWYTSGWYTSGWYTSGWYTSGWY